jgi:hypothetical protein
MQVVPVCELPDRWVGAYEAKLDGLAAKRGVHMRADQAKNKMKES